MDLSAFHAEIEAVEAGPGRPAIDPRILLVLWLYATSEGVGSARHLARLCKEHDAFRWISGGLEICHRVLSDFGRREPVPERAREPKRRMRMLAADVVVVRQRCRA